VSLVTFVAVLLLLDIELVTLLYVLKEPVVTLVEQIDLAVSAVIAALILIMLLSVRSIRKR
jgi:hypothetical protein